MLTVFITWIRSHIASERGQDLIEYALLSGVIAVAFVSIGVGLYTGAVQSMANGIGDCVDFSTSTPCKPF